MDYGFQYIIDNHGIDSEADYPYQERDEPCDKARATRAVARITGFHDVAKANENQLQLAVATGPVSVAIEADQRAFQGYAGGVLTAVCGAKLDHGVLAVGYGTDPTTATDYWIVKNSWGGTWGEQGYIRLGKGTADIEGECGIAMQPSYPVADKTPVPPSPPSPPAPTPPPGPPPPAGGFYGMPPCPETEDEVELPGITGVYCAPKCSRTKYCPAPPPNVTASPSCNLAAGTNCALLCVPSGAAAQCQAGASCVTWKGHFALCMFT